MTDTGPKLSNDASHIERIRQKATTADGMGPFWRGIMLSALNCIDAERKRGDSYGLALMMIREGCDDPRGFAGQVLGKDAEKPSELTRKMMALHDQTMDALKSA